MAYKCRYCPATFNSEDDMNTHSASHYSPCYPCPKCGTPYQDYYLMKSHLEICPDKSPPASVSLLSDSEELDVFPAVESAGASLQLNNADMPVDFAEGSSSRFDVAEIRDFTPLEQDMGECTSEEKPSLSLAVSTVSSNLLPSKTNCNECCEDYTAGRNRLKSILKKPSSKEAEDKIDEATLSSNTAKSTTNNQEFHQNMSKYTSRFSNVALSPEKKRKDDLNLRLSIKSIPENPFKLPSEPPLIPEDTVIQNSSTPTKFKTTDDFKDDFRALICDSHNNSGIEFPSSGSLKGGVVLSEDSSELSVSLDDSSSSLEKPTMLNQTNKEQGELGKCNRALVLSKQFVALAKNSAKSIALKQPDVPPEVKPSSASPEMDTLTNPVFCKVFRCAICKSIFDDQESLSEHVTILHEDGYRKNISKTMEEHMYKCLICSQLYESLEIVELHSLRHSRRRPFICRFCGLCLKDQGAYSKHVKEQCKKVQKNYKCAVCQSEWPNKLGLMMHMMWSHPEKVA